LEAGARWEGCRIVAPGGLHRAGIAGVRIGDFRRGDDDDNRTSPYGRGMRSVVFSALLEFNYLQAPIGFLALIIGPALLVGIAPSVVITYGRMMIDASAMAGSRPVVALLLVAVMAGAALWIGWPLLRLAMDNFWHLHYTLVFPIFVAVRELLRVVFERSHGRSITPEQHDRGRRVGTVLAAILLAGGGLALATSVEVSVGLQLVDVERVRFWAVLKAALGNAAVVLGLSTAAESLYWIWRELSLKGPVLDWAPAAADAGSSVVRVAHLSDLHLVGERYGYRMEAGTHGPRGNRRMRNALRKLQAIHALTPLDRVLVTGDVTDAGTRAEWAAFLDLLRGCPELRARLSFVPGNHDVNIIDRTNPARLDLPWNAGQSLRKLRTVLALDAIQGDRSHLVDHASGALGPSLADYLREGERAALLRALLQRGTLRGRREMAKVWDAIFPLVERPRTKDGPGVILLNSNARTHFSLTNAVGVVSPSQLRALELVLRGNPQHAWIILLHHHVVEYPVASIGLRDRVGLSLVNAPAVLAAITPNASRILVLHGHRHRDWIGACGDVVLCSAPSATLGAEGGDKHNGCFHIHSLAVGAGGSMRLTATERVLVA
jgi:3',5'-cyclic AMP phosphodiesterase CpdA